MQIDHQLHSYKDSFTDYIHQLQDEITIALEKLDGGAKFQEDKWEREGGGGGKSRIIENGNVIEKGGVNTSVVNGTLPKTMQKYMNISEGDFFACGISLVIHPKNPMVPTVHMNVRYFELYKDDLLIDQWFGGGLDLTPYYIFEEDATHFHQTLATTCDAYGEIIYPAYKAKCDKYFYNSHRDEHRGIGGIFFDYLKGNKLISKEDIAPFTRDVGNSFLKAYLPIVEKRKDVPYTKEQRDWQEIRRGRYVEFNLIHDRGTLFGLKTKGRIESILMSLPPHVQWRYDHHPEPNSHEEKTLLALKPKDWAHKIIN